MRMTEFSCHEIRMSSVTYTKRGDGVNALGKLPVDWPPEPDSSDGATSRGTSCDCLRLYHMSSDILRRMFHSMKVKGLGPAVLTQLILIYAVYYRKAALVEFCTAFCKYELLLFFSNRRT